MYSSARFTPPVKAVVPSTTMILRWSRLFITRFSHGTKGLKAKAWMPSASSCFQYRPGSTVRLPASS